MRGVLRVIAAGLLLASLATPGVAGPFVVTPTFREEARSSGSLIASCRLIEQSGDEKKGETVFGVGTVLHKPKDFTPPRRIPLDRRLTEVVPLNTPFLMFCKVDGKVIEPYRGILLEEGRKTAEYVKKAISLDPKKPADNLSFFFAHLDDADPEVARDAYRELTKASERDLLAFGSKLKPTKLRDRLRDPKTPNYHLRLYAMFLGACGKKEDGEYLRELLDSKEERYQNAIEGILAGYILLEPKLVWTRIHTSLRDPRLDFTTWYSVLRVVRFSYHTAPEKSRANVLKAVRTVVYNDEMCDLGIEDLRRWEIWDLTDEVLKNYGKKGFDAPLVKRAIIRYALCCKPTEASKRFLAERRKDEGEIVDEVAEYLKLEKQR